MTVDYNTIAKNLKFEGRAFINGKYVEAIALVQGGMYSLIPPE